MNKNTKKKISTFRKITLLLIVFASSSFVFANVSFSGFAGGKADFSSDTPEKFSPELKIQSYFSGQLSISEDLLARAEFSVATDDLIENSVFKKTPAEFQIDELSIIFRRRLLDSANYLSAFVGTYEPIGSDIFLRRQFGIQPVASRLMESWLGLAGSVIYPLFGVGISDVLHFNAQPIALGTYIYINHELDNSYVFNTDFRFACVYRLFTFDLSAGVGVPLKQNNSYENILVVDTLYWRTGMNMLIGNNYTTSLFIQAGISSVPFKKHTSLQLSDFENAYILIEPRFRAKEFQVNITAFSLPQETVSSSLFINDTLGLNIDVFTDNLYIKNKVFVFGINSSLSFADKDYLDFGRITEFFKEDYTIAIAPYIATSFYNGEFHTSLKAVLSDMINNRWGTAFKLSVGYKSQL